MEQEFQMPCPPQALPGFPDMKAIDRAIALKDFKSYLERLMNDTDAYLTSALEEAAYLGEETPDFYVMVKYKSGTSFTPDPKLLEEKFPAKFRAWYAAELKTFNPKLTKKAAEALWQVEGTTKDEKKASKAKNAAEMQSIMVEHPVKPQYSLASIKDREKWKADRIELEVVG